MRDDFLHAAQEVVNDPYVLINIVSLRVKQLRRGHRPLVESLEKLSAEDTALREIAEGKISFESAPQTLRVAHERHAQRAALSSSPPQRKVEAQ